MKILLLLNIYYFISGQFKINFYILFIYNHDIFGQKKGKNPEDKQ